MSRRETRAERGEYPLPPPSKCAKFLYYTWKLCSVVFSHFVMISLVVAYCILGAATFEQLEATHEKEVKMNISQIRRNTTQSIWSMTRQVPLLDQGNWTTEVVDMLKDFENAILSEMKIRGWDGNESTEHIQWTFTGALFYSIIVITTIGYGHIAPKTQTGKVVTIFYAILGIPLMLLCLSNIGDVMASSFRFLYWRVCCYVCTRPPKRRHRHHHHSVRRSVRGGSGRGSTRKKARPIERAHSDTDCRYRDSGYSSGRVRRSRQPPAPQTHATSLPRTRSQPPFRRQGSVDYDPEDRSPVRFEKYGRETARYDDEEDDFPKISLPLQDLAAALRDLEDHHVTKASKSELRSKSLPRPAKTKPEYGPRRDFDEQRHLEPEEQVDMYEMHDLHDVDYENYKERKALEKEKKVNKEDYGYRDRGYDPEDEDYEFDSPRYRKQRREWRHDRGRSEMYKRDRDEYHDKRNRRAKSAVYDYEGHWEDEREERRAAVDVEAGRGRRLRRLHTVDDSRPYRYTPSPEKDDWSDEVVPRRSRPPPAWGSRQSELYPSSETPKEEIKPVPIWLCVLLVASYIVAGTFLFKRWENWAYLNVVSGMSIKPVPIWLCVLLVASYIVAGTFLFKRWENWAYLDAAYFCFITLTTIGFGDFVPAQGQRVDDPTLAVHSIALCSLYLLFGIALLAMSFNLVQEEVRANVASLATKLGIIKPRDSARRDSDSDY